MAKRRIAIVDDVAGTTRDRVTATIHQGGYQVELIDTGGMGLEPDTKSPDARLWPMVQKQIAFAIAQSDVIILETDIRDGLTGLDTEIAQLLRPHNKPVIVAANKADNPKSDSGISEFYSLGFGEPTPVSALRRRGIDDLWDEISKQIKQIELTNPPNPLNQLTPGIKLAIVGKRNVGKSTLVNTLAKEERVIVSDIPGTTRDSIDVRFEFEGKSYIAIDTAGLMKKARTKGAVDFYSRNRTEIAISRADVVLFLIDAAQPVSEVDKKIANFIAENYKPVIIVINKWDLAEGKATTESYLKYLGKVMPFITFAPMIFISALNGFNVAGLFQLSHDLYRQGTCKITTPQLNRVMEKIKQRLPTGGRTGKMLKIYYSAQTGIQPPTINLVVNDPRMFGGVTMRYLQGQLQKALPFKEVPIKINVKGR